MEDQRQLQFYCPEHKRDFVARVGRGVTVSCGNNVDEHALTRDFPGDGFWEYCCDCERFFPLRQPQKEAAGPTNERCPNCERESARHFLCQTCYVVSFWSSERVVPAPTHKVSATGRIHPHCPACLTKVVAAVRIHECRLQRVEFTTTREQCPFCKEAIQPDAPDVDSEAGTYGVAPAGGVAADAPAQLKAAEPVLLLSDGNDHAPETDNALATEEEAAAAGADGQTAVEVSGANGSAIPGGAARRFLERLPYLKQKKLTLGSTAIIIPLLLYPFQEPIKGWAQAAYTLVTNHRPTIDGVEGDKKVQIGGSGKLKANAKDVDDEKLTFKWEPPPGGKIEGEGETVTLNLAECDALPNETVKVKLVVFDSHGAASEPFTKDVHVVPLPSNHDPELSPITAEPPQVTVGKPVKLRTGATDPDGDEPTYEWSCSSGWFEGNNTNSPTAVLNTTGVPVLPSTSVNIRVTVIARDKHGGHDKKEIDVSVVAPREITSPSPTPQNESPDDAPQVVIAPPDRLTLTAGESLRLLANASDRSGDRLIYEWHPGNTNARIEGDGPDVTLNTSGLKALNAPLRLLVTLIVKNLHGGKSVPAQIHIEVRPPAPASVEPVPSAHPEPTAPVSPTPSPSPSPAAKSSGR